MELKRTKRISKITENAKHWANDKALPPPNDVRVLKNPVRLLPDYTSKRREYEFGLNAIKELERQYKRQMHSMTESGGNGARCDATLNGLGELQKFRLNHANDCFSMQRQLDLKIDKILNDKGKGNCGYVVDRFNALPPTPYQQPKTMPYAMRQRLLRHQLEGNRNAEGL